jgi:hypothetical protein
MKSLFLAPVCAAASALALCSCASVSVRGLETSGARPVRAPQRFLVEPFSVARTDVKENAMGREKGRIKHDAQRLIANYLVKELSQNIAPATLARSRGSSAQNAWVVSGELTKVYEGNRLLRMGIGLGAGGTKMETRVAVRNASAGNRPFLQFATSGGSNAMPGAATNPIPFSSAPSALLQTTTGVTDDAARTARQITAAIADYMVERGWLAPGKVRKPKIATR